MAGSMPPELQYVCQYWIKRLARSERVPSARLSLKAHSLPA